MAPLVVVVLLLLPLLHLPPPSPVRPPSHSRKQKRSCRQLPFNTTR